MKKIIFSIFILFTSTIPSTYGQLPDGFVDEKIEGPWDYIVGFVFDETGGMYAWERAGKIFLVENDRKAATPCLDISEEVGFFGDHGMLGMTLHPNFLNNGYIYLLYAVDRHHLLHYGTARYDPAISLTNEASMGRLTRYTLSKADSFRSVVPNSRKILLGSTLDDGIPLLHTSHGVGDLLFGSDGSLMVSCGDGSTFKAAFNGGGKEGTYAAQALVDGILKPKEDVGSYRAQLVDSHNGKVLRIHPETGLGIPSNPFYDVQEPGAPRSRVWALGFRNPFRMSLLPGSGSHQMEEGNPGTIYVGDVGSGSWEEINIISGPGQNFGWPVWEGMTKNWGFWNNPAYNQDAPNPIHGQGNCEHPFFRFRDLIIKDTEAALPFWKNPCDISQEVPPALSRFIHKRPTLTYNNFLFNPPTRTFVGSFDSTGNPISVHIENAPWGFTGNAVDGTCIIEGVHYQGESFPPEYKSKYFFADFSGWISILQVDNLGHPISIKPFTEGIGKIVHLDVHPQNGCLYYVTYAKKELHKIGYQTDVAPVTQLQLDRNYGPSPLIVQFDGSLSYDPQGQPIDFLWDFGDGKTSTEITPSHSFSTSKNEPTSFHVQLTVTDSVGKSSSQRVVVSVNNTPPQVFIKSLKEGSRYAMGGINNILLEAEVSDLEHHEGELHYEWQAFLVHNAHEHPEPIDTQKVTQFLLEPAGCDGEFYSYRIALTVHDKNGLSGYHEINLFPNCDSLPTQFGDLDATYDHGVVTLRWETLWEKEVASYEIERAPDRLHFESIGELAAHENVQGKSNYGYADLRYHPGLNVYRLKINTIDGGFHYGDPLQVETYVGSGIELYPNPTAGNFAVRFKDMKGKASFELFELTGKRVAHFNWEGTGKNLRVISLNHIQEGLYFYVLKNGHNQIEGKLLIAR